MTFRNTLLAATAMLSAASAHIILEKPVPYSKDSIDNGPISANQFPCKSNLGFKVSEVTKIPVGEAQPITWKGTAVHNGGLCQLSVALTREPTADTVFKVIKTIEGGCPGLNGNTAPGVTYTLPDSIPSGEATFAWTWMPTSSGGPEYYMNCAPIEVEGGASDDSGFSQLPDMLVANLPGLTDCTQVVNTVVQAPNPGEVVESLGGDFPTAPPTGNCGGSGNAPPIERRSSSTISQQPTAVPSNPGGIFAPSASSQSTTTTLVTVTASPSAPQPTATGGAPVQPSVQPSATGGSPVSTPTAAPSQPTGGAPSGGNTCSENGAIVCNGESQFGICDNGKLVWQQVAAGTACTNGTIQKRAFYGRYARPAY